MELPTPDDLTMLHDRLTRRRHELHNEVDTAEQARREAGDDAAHEVVDRKDEAAQRLLADVDGAQEQRDIDEVAQVDAALQRLDSGNYGICVECGEPIARQRLLVQPAAPRCVPCQEGQEHPQPGPRRSGP